MPVVTVDEEIYRLLPALVIATVDKFAQLPWQGPLHTLFGRVERKCTRHGYRSPDLDKVSGREERDSHNKTRRPAGREDGRRAAPLRPPDLIIQDELHLITGPLGTMVGLYETAIDALASWTLDGQTVRPKVVASTATIRRGERAGLRAVLAQAQRVPAAGARRRRLVLRRAAADDRCRPAAATSGSARRACGSSRSRRACSRRVLAAAQTLFDKYGEAADPWMTLVGYFNALRELGGMRRIVDDDVSNRLRRTDRKRTSPSQAAAAAGADQPHRVRRHPGHPRPARRRCTIRIAPKDRPAARSTSCSPRT